MAYINGNEVLFSANISTGVAKEYVDRTFATKESVAELDSKITRNDKRITNLEKGITPEPYETDASVAYVKDVPEDALPFAAVNTLGGMTRKCTNLFDVTNYCRGLGILNADGSVTLSAEGNLNCAIYYTGKLPSGTYTISNLSGTLLYVQFSDEDYTNGVAAGGTKTFTYDGVSYLKFLGNTQYAGESVTYKVMLNAGTTVPPYEPYFEGLRSAPTEEVESVGANLLKLAEKSETRSGVTLTASADSITLNGTATADIYFNVGVVELAKGTYALSCQNAVSWANRLLYCEEEATWTAEAANAVHSWKGGMCNFMIYVASGTANSNVTLFPMLNKGETALPHSPYVRNALPIPEAVQALDGYGEGVNESVYNYIDYEKKQFVKRVGKVVLDGNEGWYESGSTADFKKYIVSLTPSPKAYSNCITNLSGINDTNQSELNYYVGGMFNVWTSQFATCEEFTAHLANNPITLVYELATPEVTDISDILPADNYIGVEGGGTLTFKNQFEFDVPSEVTYALKGEIA